MTNHSIMFVRRNLYEFLLLCLYKVVIEYVYLYNISPSYSYMYLSTNISFVKCLLSWILFSVLSLFLVLYKEKSSKMLLFILHLFIFIPSVSYFWMNNQPYLYTIFLSLSMLTVIFTAGLSTRNAHLVLPISSTKDHYVMFFCLFLAIAIALIIQRGGIDSRTLSFRTIYLVRANEKIDGIWGYLKNWTVKCFFPFLFAYFITKKRKLLLFTTIALEVFLYLSFGNKAFLLCIAWALLIFWCEGHGEKRYIFLVSSLLVLCVISVITSELFNINLLRDAIPYRLLFIPAQIQFQYYEFFSVNSKMFFSEGIIGKVFGLNNTYGEAVAYVIGRLYSPDGEISHSNTCFFADAYYNAGFVGMMVISIITGLILGRYDKFKSLSRVFVITSVSYIMFSFADTGLQTTLITGGLLLNLLLLSLLDDKEREKRMLSLSDSASICIDQ